MPSPYNACCRQLIFKLTSYFEEECSNGGPLLSVTKVRQRVSDALGVGRVTVGLIIKEKYGRSGMEDNEFKDPNKKRRRKKKGDTTIISEVETKNDKQNDSKVSEIHSPDSADNFIHDFMTDSSNLHRLERSMNSEIQKMVTNISSNDQATSESTNKTLDDVPHDDKVITQSCDSSLNRHEPSHTLNNEDKNTSIGVTIKCENVTEDELKNQYTTFGSNTLNDNDIFEPMSLVTEESYNIRTSELPQSTSSSLNTNEESHTPNNKDTRTSIGVTVKCENVTADGFQNQYTNFVSNTRNKNDILEPMCVVTEDNDIELSDLPQNTSSTATKGNRVVATFKIGRIKGNPLCIEDNLKVPAPDPRLIIDLTKIKTHVKAYHARKESITINKLLASLEYYGINYGGSKTALLKILDQIGFKFKKST